jgi:hypothetical protein
LADVVEDRRKETTGYYKEICEEVSGIAVEQDGV